MRRISLWSRSRSSGLEWSIRQARSEIASSESRRYIHLLRHRALEACTGYGSDQQQAKAQTHDGRVERDAMNNEPRRKFCTCPTVNARENAHTIRKWQHRACFNRNLKAKSASRFCLRLGLFRTTL